MGLAWILDERRKLVWGNSGPLKKYIYCADSRAANSNLRQASGKREGSGRGHPACEEPQDRLLLDGHGEGSPLG